MKKHKLLFFIPIILCSPLFLLEGGFQQDVTLHINNNAEKVDRFTSEKTTIDWYQKNTANIDKIISENGMYVWEVESALINETKSDLTFAKSTFIKSLFYKQSSSSTAALPSIDNYKIVGYNTIGTISYGSNPSITFSIQLLNPENNGICVIPPIRIEGFKKIQLPTKIVLNSNYSNVYASEQYNEWKQNGGMSNVIEFEHGGKIPNSPNPIIYSNVDNNNLSNIYPKFSSKLKNPNYNPIPTKVDDSTGSIDVNLNFEDTGNPIGFNIAYFDKNSIPIRFTETDQIQEILSLNGFKIKNDQGISLFNGTDGQYLFWTIIALVILIMVSIILLIIYKIKKRDEYIRKIKV